jgi:hypothetical protein
MAPYEPSDREDEYFLRLDAEKIEKMRTGPHWMKCPKCGADLEEINYQNVMIDTCKECKGIWLDHGELELLSKGQAQFTKGFLNRVFG